MKEEDIIKTLLRLFKKPEKFLFIKNNTSIKKINNEMAA